MYYFGTHDDWSTWSGVEIGERILHFLNSKIDRSSTDNSEKVSDVLHGDETNTSGMSEFFNFSEPPISLGDYIKRVIHYTRISVSPVNLAVALFYIDRIERRGLCKVTKNSIFRLFSTAYLIAFKRTEDSRVMKNSEYCKIAGIALAELNQLEMNFLISINFELGIGCDGAICQGITRILVPPKVSPEILLSEKQTSTDMHRWTPDSIIDLEDSLQEYYADEDDFDDESFENRSQSCSRHEYPDESDS
jgi:Cyclin